MQILFEGSEKKLEVIVRDGVNLLQLPEDIFLDLIQAARTQVLSKIENSEMRAYLLSESSLFVWQDRFTMITCGITSLVEAALKSIEKFGKESIDALIYQRKNEYFPQMQRTDFFQDIKRLNRRMAGQAFRLGPADEHHLFLFHSDKEYKPKKKDTTLEILMYNLKGKAKDIFNTEKLDADHIRKETGVDTILKGFQIDDYAFDPFGYSINAIKGQQYYTIHVTPQEVSPYVSFETNLTSRSEIQKTLSSVLEVFQPRSFDLVYFDTNEVAEVIDTKSFARRHAVKAKLGCGYTVHFAHFSEPAGEEIPPFQLKI